MTTVAQNWDAFARGVLSKHAGRVQVVEMRRAFYAGAWAMLCVTRDEVAAQEDDEAGVAMLEDLHRECLAFREAVNRGQA